MSNLSAPSARTSLSLTALEAREVPTGVTFNPDTGVLRVEMDRYAVRPGQPEPAQVLCRVVADSHGDWRSRADDLVAVDTIAGAPKSPANTRTGRFEPVRVDQVRRIEVIGTRFRDVVDLGRVSAENGFVRLHGADVEGRAGNDTLNGTGGHDVLVGGIGDDVLRGMAGNDFLDGGDGHDRLHGDAGRDRLRGGAGNDALYVAPDAPDDVDGGTGDNVVFHWMYNPPTPHTLRNVRLGWV